jgi:hypothetical protein
MEYNRLFKGSIITEQKELTHLSHIKRFQFLIFAFITVEEI